MYLIFQGLRKLTGFLPLPVAQAIGSGLGFVAYIVLTSSRHLSLRHLGLALGTQIPAPERRRIARGMFRNLGKNAIEWMMLQRLSDKDLTQLIDAKGLEHLRSARRCGSGAIVVTAHFGNWELIPIYLRMLGFEGAVLARRLRYPEYEAFLIDMRGKRGVPTIARGSVKEVAKLLRANQLVGVMPDQDIDSLEGVFINFFGHPAHTPVGPAALSLMTGAPIVPCFIVREGRRFRLVAEPPLKIPQSRDREAALIELTQAWSDVVESYIRRFPDHWVWMHRRWKTQAPNPSCAPQPAVNTDKTKPGVGRPHPALSCLLACGCLLLAAISAGCTKAHAPGGELATGTEAVGEGPNEEMSAFTLTGYDMDGSKRWKLDGRGANVDENIVTVHHPDGVGYDSERTAYLTASAAQINQKNRNIRMEHDVTIHTSDGLWLTSPILYWLPDDERMSTDQPVRIETDHMLLRGRGAQGWAQFRQLKIEKDVELVLNPSDHDVPGGPAHVTITCDGPLSFDYENHIATFENNVHVQDHSGDLYSDKLIAYLDPDTRTIRYAEAIGRVRIHQDENTAMSERAVYEPASGKITLVGKPSLLIYPSPEGQGPAQISFGGLIDSGPSVSEKGKLPSADSVNATVSD